MLANLNLFWDLVSGDIWTNGQALVRNPLPFNMDYILTKLVVSCPYLLSILPKTGRLIIISPSPLHNVWAVSTALASGHPPVDKPTPLFSSQRLSQSGAFPLTDLSTIGSRDCRPRNAAICFKRRFGQIEAEENQNRQRVGSVMESWNKFAWKQKEASIIFIAEEAETSWTVSQPSFANYVRRLLVIGYCIGYWCANCAMFIAYGPGARFG